VLLLEPDEKLRNKTRFKVREPYLSRFHVNRDVGTVKHRIIHAMYRVLASNIFPVSNFVSTANKLCSHERTNYE